MITHITVTSSTVKSIGYDEASQTLEVKFRSNSLYQYYGVQPDVWIDFQNSSSKGKFLNRRIKDRYKFKKAH